MSSPTDMAVWVMWNQFPKVGTSIPTPGKSTIDGPNMFKSFKDPKPKRAVIGHAKRSSLSFCQVAVVFGTVFTWGEEDHPISMEQCGTLKHIKLWIDGMKYANSDIYIHIYNTVQWYMMYISYYLKSWTFSITHMNDEHHVITIPWEKTIRWWLDLPQRWWILVT